MNGVFYTAVFLMLSRRFLSFGGVIGTGKRTNFASLLSLKYIEFMALFAPSRMGLLETRWLALEFYFPQAPFW